MNIRPIDPIETQSGRVEMILRLCEEYRRQTNADIQFVLARQIHEVANPPLLVCGHEPTEDERKELLRAEHGMSA